MAVVLAVSSPAAAAARLPDDVQARLAARSIVVGPPVDAPASLPVSARKALRMVRHDFRDLRGDRPAVYLVRIVGHPNAFDPLPPGSRGWTDIHPLAVGDLAWVVVIRNAEIPVLGPPRGAHPATYIATLVVLVETTRPRWVVGITI